MKILIDMREKSLITSINPLLQSSEISMEVKSLPLGDIILFDERTNKELVIIERKNILDLAASISDGRYVEQSFRLNGTNLPNHNIIYLIEGNITVLSNFNTKIIPSTMYSAMFSLNYYKGFSVNRTLCVDESAKFIYQMASNIVNKTKQNITGYYTNINTNKEELSSGSSGSSNYIEVVKREKNKNVTPQNIKEIMLCQIPKISTVSANAIVSHFKTWQNLLEAIQSKSICDENITYMNNKGQSRKISKTVIDNLIEYLQ